MTFHAHFDKKFEILFDDSNSALKSDTVQDMF